MLGFRPPVLHCEASAAIERRERSRWSLVRPGIFLYGAASTADGPRARRVVQLRARIVDIRTIEDGDRVSYQQTYGADGQRRIATLGIGYADGYRRSFSQRGLALVRGRRVPVVGSVTMDMTMVDVTGVDCEIGDAATLIGKDGADVLELSDVAKTATISPYELLAGLRMRIRHVHTGRV
jgi:alanine racemase